jgi:hypothetical protein
LEPHLKTIAADQLPAALWTGFLIAVRMMFSTRGNVAVGTAEPLREMEFFGIVGNGWPRFPAGVLNRGVPFAGKYRRILCFLLTFFANAHDFPAQFSVSAAISVI